MKFEEDGKAGRQVLGHLAACSKGEDKWTYTKPKRLTERVKIVRLGNILDSSSEDEISDPKLLRESGGHIDPESDEFVEDEGF